MATRPQWRQRIASFADWIHPPWRRRRSAHLRAGAWAAVGIALACYLFAFLYLGPSGGAAVAALYVLPCVVAGWAFGASGGLLVALLTAPIHAWLFSAGLVRTGSPGALAPVFGLVSALVVGVSAGVARDLRERLHERTAALTASEDRYRQLVDNSPEGVLVHERGVIVFANPSMARLVGANDPKQLLGRTLVTLAPFEDREGIAHGFVHAQHDRRAPLSVEARLARADGECVPVVMTSMPIDYREKRARLVLVRERALVERPTSITRAVTAALR